MERLRKQSKLLGIKMFWSMSKSELGQEIRDGNSKGSQTNIDDILCTGCLRDKHKQHLINKKLYTE